MTRVALLFDNFGPYHLARLSAAAKVCELLAIEVNRSSREYAWGPDERGNDGSFRRICLMSTESEASIHAPKADDKKENKLRIRLAEVLAAFKPEAVAIPGWSSRVSFEAILWCARACVPAVVMSESQATDARRGVVKEFIKRRVVRCFSAALVGGGSHRGYLVKLGMKKERVFCGYDTVDNEYFARGVEQARREFRRKGEERKESTDKKVGRYFLAVARFIEKKNLQGLLGAYARYRDCWGEAMKHAMGKGGASRFAHGMPEERPWDLVILGDGDLRTTLEKLVRELGLSGHVDLPGFKQYEDLPVYYASAGAFIHPSVVEPWGLVVNEAMASGLLVLVSNRCGCAAELVREGVNGFRFDPSDNKRLAELMTKVSAPGFPVREFGNASQRIIADWGVEQFASGLERAVEAAVGRRKRIALVERWIVGMVEFGIRSSSFE